MSIQTFQSRCIFLDFFSHFYIHAFFNKQHFYKQRQVKIDKNQAKAKQHPEADFFKKNFKQTSAAVIVTLLSLAMIMQNRSYN